jgi:hypothetical protein
MCRYSADLSLQPPGGSTVAPAGKPWFATTGYPASVAYPDPNPSLSRLIRDAESQDPCRHPLGYFAGALDPGGHVQGTGSFRVNWAADQVDLYS